jgi:hypothetical protein
MLQDHWFENKNGRKRPNNNNNTIIAQ